MCYVLYLITLKLCPYSCKTVEDLVSYSALRAYLVDTVEIAVWKCLEEMKVSRWIMHYNI